MNRTSFMLVGLTLCALPATAQTPAAGTQQAPPQTVTLSGCVASVNNSPSVFTLSNAAIVPTSAQPGTPTNVPAPMPIGTAAAQPPATPATPPVSAPATPPVTVPATPPATTPATPPATAATAPPNPATSGVTRAAPAATGINAAAPSASINAAAQPAASVGGGYRLSGVNMSSFSGRRVQVVGAVVPPTTPGSAGAVGTSGTAGLPIQEFRVQSVQPISGDCPPQ
jgi:hypothetical protein